MELFRSLMSWLVLLFVCLKINIIRRKMMKNKLWALLIVIGVGVSLVSYGGNTTNSGNSQVAKPTSQQTGKSQNSGTIYEIGQTGTAEFGIDKFEITVTGAAKEYVDESMRPGAGTKYLYLPIKVKNVSSEDSSFSPRVSMHIMYSDKALTPVMYAGENDLGRGVKVFTSSEIKVGETLEGNILLWIQESKQEGMLLCYKAKLDGTALLKFKVK